MTTSDEPIPPPLGERHRALAAEHALGLTDAVDARAAQALKARDPAFAAELRVWRRHLLALDLAAPATEPTPDLWSRVETNLDGASTEAEAGTSALDAATGDASAPVPTPHEVGAEVTNPAGRRPTRSWLDRLGFAWRDLTLWRTVGFAGAAASVALAAALHLETRRADATPVLVAVLVTDANEPAAVVNAFRDGRAELVALRGFEVPAGRAIEIWTLWDRAIGPRSIGLIGGARTTRLDLRDFPRQPGQLFEMTLEPAQGSPTGRPTGPILTKGLAAQPL